MKKTMIYFCTTILILSLGIWSGLSTRSQISHWYVHIYKPSWTPPNWLFGPVWTLLYLLIGIALAKVILTKNTNKNPAYLAFTIQFLLNLAWSQLFFVHHFIGIAFIEMILLWLAIIVTMCKFKKVNISTFYYLLPYFLWVSFALVLNGSIYFMNR